MTDRIMTPREALLRLQNLCSQREKCTGEINEKLRQWKIPAEDKEKIVESLKKDKFIDDRRFAVYFVRDKQRINKWGSGKIRFALKAKGLSQEIIDEAFAEMPVENFESTLKELLEKKSKELSKYSGFEKKNRLIRFAMQRGFDYEEIFRLTEEVMRHDSGSLAD